MAATPEEKGDPIEKIKMHFIITLLAEIKSYLFMTNETFLRDKEEKTHDLFHRICRLHIIL